ncbi:MAG: hypothetical protein IJH34_17365 [Romboutsia sp.]|nr:hypothetical protein [Romboutsia sp.]
MFLNKIRKNNPKFRFTMNDFLHDLKIVSKPIKKFISLLLVILSINISSLPTNVNYFNTVTYASEFHLDNESVTDGLFLLLDIEDESESENVTDGLFLLLEDN